MNLLAQWILFLSNLDQLCVQKLANFLTRHVVVSMLSVVRLWWWTETCNTGYECLLHESWWSSRLDLWEGNLLLEFMDALLELLFELLPLGFSGVKGSLLLGSGGFKGSLLLGFSLCKNGLVLSFSLCKNDLVFGFSLGNSSLDSLVYRSLFLSLEVSGGDSTELEQVALVVSLLSLIHLFEFISQLLFPLKGFFQLCFFQLFSFL